MELITNLMNGISDWLMNFNINVLWIILGTASMLFIIVKMFNKQLGNIAQAIDPILKKFYSEVLEAIEEKKKEPIEEVKIKEKETEAKPQPKRKRTVKCDEK